MASQVVSPTSPRITRCFVALALGLGFGTAIQTMAQAPAPTAGKPAATTQRIDENRYGQLDPKYMSTGHSTMTAILLKVTGLSFKPARAGDFKIVEAVDDLGTDLKKPFEEQPVTFKGLQSIYNANPDNSFTLTLNIGRSPRKATKITSIKGEFTVVGGGEDKDVTIAGVSEMMGKTIENAELKKVGLTLTVRAPIESLKGQAVLIDVDGPIEAVKTMQLLGPDGKVQPSSFAATPAADGKPAQLFIGGGKIDATYSVKISYVAGLQKVVIPMEYKDIALP